MPYDGLPSGSRNIHDCTHFPNGVGHAHEHRPTYDRVADVELLDFGNRGDRPDVSCREPVARVHRQPELLSLARGVLERPESGGVVRMVSVPTGVQLDRDSAKVAGPRDRAEVRIDEEARSDPDGTKRLDGRTQPLGIAGNIEPTLGRDLLPTLGNE